MKIYANKYQKTSRLHDAGNKMTACCDNLWNVHTLCGEMQELFHPYRMIYTVTIVFLTVYGVVTFYLKVTNKTQNYILFNIKVLTLGTNKNSEILIYCSP
jgi:hypothetical protein